MYTIMARDGTRSARCIVCRADVRVARGRPRRTRPGGRIIVLYKRFGHGFEAVAVAHDGCLILSSA